MSLSVSIPHTKRGCTHLLELQVCLLLPQHVRAGLLHQQLAQHLLHNLLQGLIGTLNIRADGRLQLRVQLLSTARASPRAVLLWLLTATTTTTKRLLLEHAATATAALAPPAASPTAASSRVLAAAVAVAAATCRIKL